MVQDLEKVKGLHYSCGSVAFHSRPYQILNQFRIFAFFFAFTSSFSLLDPFLDTSTGEEISKKT